MADYWSNVSFIIKFGSREDAESAKAVFDEFERGVYTELYDDPDWRSTGCKASVDSKADEPVLWYIPTSPPG